MAKVEINAFVQSRWPVYAGNPEYYISLDIDDLDIDNRKAMIKALVESL